MTRRNLGILLAFLVGAPVVWATLVRVRDEGSARLLRAVATAHERTGYSGSAAERHTRWHLHTTVEHDADTGATVYGWRDWLRTRKPSPSARTPDPAAWCMDVEAAAENYIVSEEGRTRYLGRRARTLRVEPRHRGRPRLRIIADEATLLPLEVATFRPNGELLRVKAFRRVEIGPRTVSRDHDREFLSWGGTTVPPDELEALAGFELLRPDYLPAGFRCIEARLAHAGPPVAYLVYSDGVTVLELRQSPVWTPARTETALVKQMGPLAAKHALEWMREQHLTRVTRFDPPAEGVSVVRDRGPAHVVYDLRVGGRDVRLTSRADLDEEESFRVLRSLR